MDHERSSPVGARLQFNDGVVTILVGLERTPFTVHRDILCRHSKYFAARLSGRWTEDNEVLLPDADIDAFQNYAEFLYSPTALHRLISDEEQSIEGGVDTLVQLYILGEFLDDRTLRNHVMYQFFQLLETSPGFRWSAETINVIFEGTHEGCNLQEYIVADHLFDTSPDWIEDSADGLSPRFTKRLLHGWAAKSQQPKIVYQHPNDSKFEYWQVEGIYSAKRRWEGFVQEPSRREKRAEQILLGRPVSTLPVPLSPSCATSVPTSGVASPNPLGADVSPVDRKPFEGLP